MGKSIRKIRRGASRARAPLEKEKINTSGRRWFHMGRITMWAGVQTAADVLRAEIQYLPPLSMRVPGGYLNLPGGDYDDTHVIGLFTARAKMYPGGVESPRSVIHQPYMYVPIIAALTAVAIDPQYSPPEPLRALVDSIFASHPAPGAVWSATGYILPCDGFPVSPTPARGAARIRNPHSGVRLPQLPPHATDQPGEGLRYARDVVVALHGVLLGAAAVGEFSTDYSTDCLHAPGLQLSPSVVLLAADIPGTRASTDHVVGIQRASYIRAAMQCVWSACLALTYREFRSGRCVGEVQSVVDVARKCWEGEEGYSARGELPPPLVAALEGIGVRLD